MRTRRNKLQKKYYNFNYNKKNKYVEIKVKYRKKIEFGVLREIFFNIYNFITKL